jgi:Type II CAAX prenyl endopeptidase Rce1-like
MINIWIKIVILAALLLAFYRWLSPSLLNPFRRWMTIPSLEARHPTRDVYAAVRLLGAASLQALLFWFLLNAFAVRMRFSIKDLDPVIAVLSILLGIAEMSVATLLGYSAMRTVGLLDAAAGRRSPPWSGVAKGGWIQMYFKTIEVLPIPFGALAVLAYIAFEECIFRGIVIGIMLPAGPYVAVVGSTILFATYQIFHTPGWRTAIFPILGASVVGIVHGVLYIVFPNIVPLVIAHCCFFGSALWSFKNIETAPGRMGPMANIDSKSPIYF